MSRQIHGANYESSQKGRLPFLVFIHVAYILNIKNLPPIKLDMLQNSLNGASSFQDPSAIDVSSSDEVNILGDFFCFELSVDYVIRGLQQKRK
jgi:hypothetical protein